jgi:hypothetical protein
MEKSRLLKLLRTLSPEELRGLKKFVHTPFFNQRTEVAALLDLLEKSLKKNSPAPEKRDAFLHLFGNAVYDDHRIRMAMSFLYQITGQFLTVSEFLADKQQYHIRLANIFRKRQLPDAFTGAWQEADKTQYDKPYRNADFFEERYRMLLEKYRFEVETQSTEHLDFQELSDQLDSAFLARKLWQACFMHSHQTVRNSAYHFGLLDAALHHIEQAGISDNPAISLYYHCFKALAEPEEKTHFQQFKALLTQYGNLFPADELRDLFILAINFCIRQYNAGSSDYLAEQFELYKEGFSKDFFITNGVLSRYTYQNAATIGLVMRDFAWVERFVHDYRMTLREAHREGLFCFNLARLEYQRSNPGKALQLLQRAEYKDLLLNLAAKTLQMKIFYELEEYDLLESHLQAIGTFIRRKKVMGYHRENYLNTVLFTRKLLETNPLDKSARAALHQEIEATRAVAEKEWLLEQTAG